MGEDDFHEFMSMWEKDPKEVLSIFDVMNEIKKLEFIIFLKEYHPCELPKFTLAWFEQGAVKLAERLNIKNAR